MSGAQHHHHAALAPPRLVVGEAVQDSLDGEGDSNSIATALAATSLASLPGAPPAQPAKPSSSRPKPLKRLTGLPSAVLKLNLRKGSNRHAAPADLQTPPLGLLCVRVIAARNLASKDRNGKSDPYLIIRVGDFRQESEPIKACLHPVWGELDGISSSTFTPDGASRKEAFCVAPLWQETLASTRIEVVAWDKDKLSKNEYLGEISITLDDWVDTAAEKLPVPFNDERNQPVWKRISSSKSKSKVSGDFLVKIGWLALPPASLSHGTSDPKKASKQAPERQTSTGAGTMVMAAHTAAAHATSLIESTSLSTYAANNPISSQQEQNIHAAMAEAISEYRYTRFGRKSEDNGQVAHNSPLERVKSMGSMRSRRHSISEDMVFNAPPSEGVGTLPIGAKPRGALSNELTDGNGLYDSDSSSQEEEEYEPSDDDNDFTDGQGDGYMSASTETSSLSDIGEYTATAGDQPGNDYFDLALGMSEAPAARPDASQVQHGQDGHSLQVPGQVEGQPLPSPGASSVHSSSGKRKLIPGFLRRSSKTTVPTVSSGLNPQTGSQDVPAASSSSSSVNAGIPPASPSLNIDTDVPAQYRRKKFTRRKVKVKNAALADDSADVGAVSVDGGKKSKRKHHRKTKKAKTGRKRQISEDSPISKDGHNLSTGAVDQDYLGIVFVEVKSAANLPRWRNVTRTGWDMDPFCIVSFGQKVFRTKVIRHDRNPVWDERLFFHVKRHEHAFQILFTLFDWDKMSSNDFIGEVPLDITGLADRAPKPDQVNGIFKATPDGKIIGDELQEYTLALGSKSAELEEQTKNTPTISIRAKFTPYSALRQRFWRTYLKQYDSDDSETWSWVELYSLLDSLGSTLTRQTIASFFTRFGKSTEDTLTIEECIICFEDELTKPRSEKRHCDSSNMDDSSKSGLATPYSNGSELPPLTLADNAGGAGMSFTGLPLTGEPADGVEPKDTLSAGKDFLTPDRAIQQTSTSSSASASSNNLGGGSAKSGLATPSRQSSLAISIASSTDGGYHGDSTSSQNELEKLINIKTCPLCHKKLSKKAEVDMVSHLAVCASQDWSSLSSLTVANFVSTSQAHRKWFTKLVNKVGNGSYQLGADSANILVQNRMTGQLQEEKMQVYVRVGIRLWYRAVGSSSRMEANRIKKLLRSMTFKQGVKFDAPESVSEIPRFIAFHQLDVNEIRDRIDSFENFNSFFYRKLKEDARPAADPEDPTTLVSSADCRMTCFQSVTEATQIWIKGRTFSIAKLLGDDYKHDAKKFEGGSLCIFRLAPQDYHRYHSPVDGIIGKMSAIEGEYYTVNPIAVRSTLDIYAENARVIVPMDTEAFGRVYNVCIGAMMVGSIKFTKNEGEQIKRAEEYGYFAFGGSTIVCLFEPGRVRFDDDLLNNSRACIETLVRVGMRIGKAV